MSGALNPPLLAPEQAGRLLDEIIYERVLGCIDVDALLTFECELSCAFEECGFEGDPNVANLVTEMIDRALHRAREERWHVHLRRGRSCELEPWDSAPRDALAAPRKPTKRKSS